MIYLLFVLSIWLMLLLPIETLHTLSLRLYQIWLIALHDNLFLLVVTWFKIEMNLLNLSVILNSFFNFILSDRTLVDWIHARSCCYHTYTFIGLRLLHHKSYFLLIFASFSLNFWHSWIDHYFRDFYLVIWFYNVVTIHMRCFNSITS